MVVRFLQIVFVIYFPFFALFTLLYFLHFVQLCIFHDFAMIFLANHSKETYMEYIGIDLEPLIQIQKIYTIHYFEYMRDFIYSGESHDFWEFIYVDKGTVHISMDYTSHTLSGGDIAFHQPNEFHTIEATGENAPNLIVMSFACNNLPWTFSNVRFYN